LKVLPPAPNSGVFDDHDPALALDPPHQRVRARRHMVAKDRRAVRGAHALDVHQVLDRDREPGEPARLLLRLAPLAAHQPLRVRPGALEAQRRQRVHRGLDRGDPPLRRVDELERRDLVPPQTLHRLGRAQSDEFVGHACSLRAAQCLRRFYDGPAAQQAPPTSS